MSAELVGGFDPAEIHSPSGMQYHPGDKIGVWTLVERTKVPNSPAVWRMRCVCGTEITRTTTKARRHSNGCMRCHLTVRHWLAKSPAKPPLPKSLSLDPNRTRFDSIAAMVSKFFGITQRELLGPGRSRRVSIPRMVAYALARELTLNSTTYIGLRLGGRDHTTVVQGVRRIAELRQSNPLLDEDYTALKARLTYRPANDSEAAE